MKEGKFPYFVSMFDIGPYERQKTGKNQKKIQGGGKFFFSVAIILIYITGDSLNETPVSAYLHKKIIILNWI